MKSRIRNRKTLYIVFIFVLVLVFSLTIAYAALSVTLNILGNAEVVASSWNVYLDNIDVTSGSVNGSTQVLTGGTTVSFSTTLAKPGDFYEFSIDVVNNGTIDAMIDSISKNLELTSEQTKYLKYEISYQNGESISTKQLVLKNSYVRLKIRLEYRKDLVASDLPTVTDNLNLSFSINYIQSDGNGNSVNNNGTIRKSIEFFVVDQYGVQNTYQTLENTTWREWEVESDNSYVNMICHKFLYNDEVVYLDDIIISNGVYYSVVSTCSGGSYD